MTEKSCDVITLRFGRKKEIRRKKWNRTCLLVFCGALIIIGAALAYFVSSDRVTNVIHSEDDIYIRLLEPTWDGVDVTDTGASTATTLGINMAAEMQPDIDIPKDPQVYNSSETAVYVRMQITLYNGDEKITDVDTIKALLGSLYYYDTGNNNTPVQLIPTDYISSGDGSIIETDDNTTAGTETYTTYNKTMRENNSYGFYYSGGWFYYMTVLNKGDRTTHLFDYIDVPVLKTEYQYFENGFSIEIVAQAIDATAIDTTDSEWDDYFSDIAAEFKRKYSE